MDTSAPAPTFLLCLAAVPLVLVFPPSVYPGALPVLLLLVAPSLVHGLRVGRPVSWVPVGLAGAALLLSLLCATSPHRALHTLLLVPLYAACWAAGRRFGAKEHRLLLVLLVVGGSAVALHGIYQLAFGFEQTLEAARAAEMEAVGLSRLQSGRAFSRFPLPSQLGAFLLLSLPVTLGWLAAGGPGERRWLRRDLPRPLVWGLLAAAALVQATGFLSTLSLGAFLAAAGVAGYLALRRAGPRLVVPAAGVLLVGLVLALTVRPDLAGLDRPDHPVRLRLGNWGVALAMTADHPLVGVGPGGYGVRYPAYMKEGMNETRYAHSMPLQLVAEGGLWVLLPLVLGCAALVRRLMAARGPDPRILGCAVLGFALANLWDFHLYLPSLGVCFFLLAGAWCPLRENAGTAPSRRLLSAVGLLLLVVCALLLQRGVRAEGRALRALEEGRWEDTLERLQEWEQVSPWNPEAATLLSRVRLALGDAEGAVEAAREAVRREPAAFRYAELARALEARGDRGLAFGAMHRAVELFPLRASYRRDWERLRTEAWAP